MEGYWINIESGKYEEVFEHASWIQNLDNQRLIGLTEAVGRQILELPSSDFKGKNREQIILLATHGGLIRVRRYGGAISFEFQSKGQNRKILDVIYQFLINVDIAGDYTQLTLTNLAANESIGILWQDFKVKIEKDDIESILRIARKVGRRIKNGCF